MRLRLRIGLRNTMLLLNALVVAALMSLAVQAWRASQTQHDAQARQAGLAEALHLSKQADLMHDALRFGVQASLLVGQVPGLDQFEERQRIRDDGTTYYDALQRLGKLPLPDDIHLRIQAVSERARLYAVQVHKVVQSASVDRAAAIAGLEAVDQQYRTVRRDLDDLGESLRDLLLRAQARATEEANASSASLLWVCGLTTFAASGVVALLTLSIRRRVRQLGQVARAIADGDLRRRVNGSGGDELDHLGNAIDQMADSLSTMIESMSTDAARAAFDRQLAEALDVADSEQQVAKVATQAMGDVVADRQIELLIADSSRAHMGRAALHPTAGAPGCRVESPYGCVAVRRGTLVKFADSEALNACRHLRDRDCGSTSAVCVPVAFMGRAIGVLHATAPVSSPLSSDQAQRLGTLGALIGMRIGTVRAFERSQIQASTDSLTGLPNRRTLEQRLRRLARGEDPFAVVMCDLDHFKRLNDGNGHAAGDAALRIFSEVMRQSLREGDLSARWGGEEFAFVLNGADGAEAQEQVERLRERLTETLSRGGSPPFTASFGIADSAMSRRPETLVRMADAALYQAKAEGRDRACLANPSTRFENSTVRVAETESEPATLYVEDT